MKQLEKTHKNPYKYFVKVLYQKKQDNNIFILCFLNNIFFIYSNALK